MARRFWLMLSLSLLACSSGEGAGAETSAPSASVIDPGGCKNFTDAPSPDCTVIKTNYRGNAAARLHLCGNFRGLWNFPSRIPSCQRDVSVQCTARAAEMFTGADLNDNDSTMDGAPITEAIPTLDLGARPLCTQFIRGRVVSQLQGAKAGGWYEYAGLERFLDENSVPVDFDAKPDSDPSPPGNPNAGFFEEGVVTVAGDPIASTEGNPLPELSRFSPHSPGAAPSVLATRHYGYGANDYTCYDNEGRMLGPGDTEGALPPHTFCLVNTYSFRKYLGKHGANLGPVTDDYSEAIPNFGVPRSPDVGVQYFDKTILRWEPNWVGGQVWADLGLPIPYGTDKDLEMTNKLETYAKTRADDMHIDVAVQLVHRDGNQYCNMEAIRRVNKCDSDTILELDKLISSAEAKVSQTVQDTTRGHSSGGPYPERMGCYLPAYVTNGKSEAKVHESLFFSPKCYNQTRRWVLASFGEEKTRAFERDALAFLVRPPAGTRIPLREKLKACATADGKPCQDPVANGHTERTVPELESFFNSANLH